MKPAVTRVIILLCQQRTGGLDWKAAVSARTRKALQLRASPWIPGVIFVTVKGQFIRRQEAQPKNTVPLPRRLPRKAFENLNE